MLYYLRRITRKFLSIFTRNTMNLITAFWKMCVIDSNISYYLSGSLYECSSREQHYPRSNTPQYVFPLSCFCRLGYMIFRFLPFRLFEIIFFSCLHMMLSGAKIGHVPAIETNDQQVWYVFGSISSIVFDIEPQ